MQQEAEIHEGDTVEVDLTEHEGDIVKLDEAPPAPPCNVMLDLETWGTGNNALVVSIGACKFDGDTILDRFYVAIDPVSAQAFGLEIDASTILWWLDPAQDEARRNWLGQEKIDLASAITGFDMWCKESPGVMAIWGNGATFDNVILRSAFKAVGQEYPVRFWGDQCYRTVKNAHPSTSIQREGVHHNALDDAISQAKHLQAIWRSQQQDDLRAMLERAQQQFTFYAEQHRAKSDPSSPTFVGHTLQKQALEKADVNEALALEIRYLLDGGPNAA
jgi:hypothetical protein